MVHHVLRNGGDDMWNPRNQSVHERVHGHEVSSLAIRSRGLVRRERALILPLPGLASNRNEFGVKREIVVVSTTLYLLALGALLLTFLLIQWCQRLILLMCVPLQPSVRSSPRHLERSVLPKISFGRSVILTISPRFAFSCTAGNQSWRFRSCYSRSSTLPSPFRPTSALCLPFGSSPVRLALLGLLPFDWTDSHWWTRQASSGRPPCRTDQPWPPTSSPNTRLPSL